MAVVAAVSLFLGGGGGWYVQLCSELLICEPTGKYHPETTLQCSTKKFIKFWQYEYAFTALLYMRGFDPNPDLWPKNSQIEEILFDYIKFQNYDNARHITRTQIITGP